MPEARPPSINEVMIAAGNLEDAEFERDRLVMACAVAIRSALAEGFSHAQIALAADLPELDVWRLAESPPAGSDDPGPMSVFGPAPQHEPFLIAPEASPASNPGRQGSSLSVEVPAGAGREPNASR
ncbi:hypothetical protein GM708_02375 [Vibrio cholerae]|jgi:hypothetical protein|nr:hypothetical protein [Vibrio cholerae]